MNTRKAMKPYYDKVADNHYQFNFKLAYEKLNTYQPAKFNMENFLSAIYSKFFRKSYDYSHPQGFDKYYFLMDDIFYLITDTREGVIMTAYYLEDLLDNRVQVKRIKAVYNPTPF